MDLFIETRVCIVTLPRYTESEMSFVIMELLENLTRRANHLNDDFLHTECLAQGIPPNSVYDLI